jgi:hypothetical protein
MNPPTANTVRETLRRKAQDLEPGPVRDLVLDMVEHGEFYQSPRHTQAADLPAALTRAQIFDLFHVGPHALRNWIRTGKLPPPMRMGRRLLWKRADIEALLAPVPA